VKFASICIAFSASSLLDGIAGEEHQQNDACLGAGTNQPIMQVFPPQPTAQAQKNRDSERVVLQYYKFVFNALKNALIYENFTCKFRRFCRDSPHTVLKRVLFLQNEESTHSIRSGVLQTHVSRNSHIRSPSRDWPLPHRWPRFGRAQPNMGHNLLEERHWDESLGKQTPTNWFRAIVISEAGRTSANVLTRLGIPLALSVVLAWICPIAQIYCSTLFQWLHRTSSIRGSDRGG
jgi:hypothetical protein